METPMIGSNVQIQSYKHNGQLHRVWDKNFILKTTKTHVVCANDKVKVTEDNGRTWTTREPAIVYFHAENWFNVIGMLRNNGIHYYCNLSSPFIYDGEAIKYIDYDLDIRVFPNMTYILLDEDEYSVHKKEMNYPKAVEQIINSNVEYLLSWINGRKGPFAPGFIDYWYERFLAYR